MPRVLHQPRMLQRAWIEPGTASICLYCSTLLIRGRSGVRMLSRHLKHEKEAVTDVVMDEFSDFICDHSDTFMTILFMSGSLFIGSNGAQFGCLVTRAPELVQSTKTLVRSASKSIVTRARVLIRSTRTITRIAAQSASKSPVSRLSGIPRLSGITIGGKLSSHESDNTVPVSQLSARESGLDAGVSNYRLSSYKLSNYRLSNYKLSSHGLSSYGLSSYGLSIRPPNSESVHQSDP